MGRNRKKNLAVLKLKGEKFVSGGQVLAHDESGRPIFVWGVLPGEEAQVQLTKRKKDYAEGEAVQILKSSSGRIEPQEPEYLSTSPWQILKQSEEDQAKLNILTEQFQRAGLNLKFELGLKTEQFFNYRNKMEYCFWADEDGLSLSLRKRGSNQKIAVVGSALAQSPINQFSSSLIKALNQVQAEGRQLKSVIVRCSGSSSVSAALFVKDESFPADELIAKLKDELNAQQWGTQIYFSNPKSPASVPTKLMAEYGLTILQDEIKLNDKPFNFQYSPLSFFQGNIKAYQSALSLIKNVINPDLPILDLFSGVGSIGISVAGQDQNLSLVEIDEFNTKFAKANVARAKLKDVKIVTSSSEGVLELISENMNLIVDPPRAGLHKDLVAKIIEVKPLNLIYLSCNPATQARDVRLLVDAGYQITGQPMMFNFFPRTPHIESLITLELAKN